MRPVRSFTLAASGGTVAAVGSRMLGSVTGVLIGQFFKAFERHALGPTSHSWWQRVKHALGFGDHA